MYTRIVNLLTILLFPCFFLCFPLFHDRIRRTDHVFFEVHCYENSGLITEYNPFTRGHALHLEEARLKTGADFCIAAMSGDFVQRGEPALFSKHLRTEMALRSGVDAVFELPVDTASGSAEFFAAGAVFLLTALGADLSGFRKRVRRDCPFSGALGTSSGRASPLSRSLKMRPAKRTFLSCCPNAGAYSSGEKGTFFRSLRFPLPPPTISWGWNTAKLCGGSKIPSSPSP